MSPLSSLLNVISLIDIIVDYSMECSIIGDIFMQLRFHTAKGSIACHLMHMVIGI
jgi:hypothetical protein